MMKTGKNKRLLASILAASMLLAMSPFALAEGTEGQEQPVEGGGTEQTCAAKIGETEYSTLAGAIAAANIYDANSDVTIVMLHDVTENIEINRSLTLDLDEHTLSGNGDAEAAVVTISGDETQVTVENGTVTGGKNSGFRITDADVTLNNVTATENTTDDNGGGIFIKNGTLNITGGAVTKNKAAGKLESIPTATGNKDIKGQYGGGGIYARNSSVTLNNVSISENVQTNEKDNKYHAGGILVYHGSLTMDGCTIKNNRTIGCGGGAYILHANSTISNSYIENNTAFNGAGIYFYDSKDHAEDNCNGHTHLITGSTISGNTASNIGGGMYLATTSNLTLRNSKLLKNNGAFQGGAIVAYSARTIELDGASISENTAEQGAGIRALCTAADNTDIRLLNGTAIDKNTATVDGGGIYAYAMANTLSVTAENSSISGNTAASGAGIMALCTAVGNTDIRLLNGTAIDKNTATGYGGGIYAYALANTLSVTAENSSVGGNTAAGGAGIFTYKSGSAVINVNLQSGAVMHDNNAVVNMGGAIYAYNAANINIAANSAVYNNTAKDAGDDLLLNDSTFTLPKAKAMSSDLILSSDNFPITGWYHDGYKWNAAANDGKGDFEQIDRWTAETADEYVPVENDSHAVSLKAAHPLMYTLTYDVTGDLPEGYTAPAKQTLVKGNSYTVAEVPASVSGTKDGVNGTFSFNGWKKADGTVLTGEQQLTENLTLHGVWTFTKKSSGGTDPIEWNVSRSKTATALDTSTWTSNVTLSLPSAEEALASDVVFVLDKSTSTKLEEQALGMLNNLKEQAASTKAKVKVGVVIFNKQANKTAPLTDLATGYDDIQAAIEQTIESGTNTHAGLLAGKQLLDEDTEVAANRKYLIFVSDGITYMYNAEPTATAWSFKADSWSDWVGPDNWNSKYGSNNPPADWSEWMTEIGTQVEAQGTEYEYPYKGTVIKSTPANDDTYKNYANSIDKALYLTYQVYQEAQAAGYNCYAVANGSSTGYLWGPAFMRYLANGQRVDFGTIQNDILYAVSAGSTVEDQMGDAFDFVPGSLKLTVGGKELKSKADGNMTYFGNNAENLSENNCRFKVLYAPDADGFVWTINENVSNFAPVQLTYTVKLTKPETDPGTYGVEDLKGEKTLSDAEAEKALFTNKRAVLNATNSAGAQLTPLDFPKPSVSYTVKKSSGGSSGGGGGRKPTVTIPDDVPTGLNGDDHYAYIVGYPNGNVEPNGNITRAEVATIFFRLLTEEVRTANSTQSNSLSDVTRGQWFNHAVSTLSSMGIVKGHNDGTFAPNAPITRAEFAAIAARFDDKNTNTSSKFTDIASHWAKNEIGIAANKGWINGYPDGTFRPNQYITRAEAMTLVNRVLNRLPENSSDLLDSMIKWPDNSDASAWYYLAVQEATNSHYYKTKENKFEKWTELRKTRDWTELEK